MKLFLFILGLSGGVAFVISLFIDRQLYLLLIAWTVITVVVICEQKTESFERARIAIGMAVPLLLVLRYVLVDMFFSA